jgi:hypothetical protein
MGTSDFYFYFELYVGFFRFRSECPDGRWIKCTDLKADIVACVCTQILLLPLTLVYRAMYSSLESPDF